MELFSNLIYEFKKGMRDLSLYTCNKVDLHKFVQHLDKTGTKYVLRDIGKDKVNIFFGDVNCLNILNKFSSSDLNELTPYEDFILGIMLGYSRAEQYGRILSRI
ncbi:DUF2023 family protein [bacterium]|nr:DUF2023 family protein [bacterium]